jgi:hypothetical protein
MRSIGLGELVVVVFYLLPLAAAVWAVWTLHRMADALAGIRTTLGEIRDKLDRRAES